jgi:geranylgeranyl pyrophosphate synthase
MSAQEDIAKVAISMIEKRGRPAKKKAQKEMLQRCRGSDTISLALKYYAQVAFPKVMPIFPALLALSFEAAGGDSAKTELVGAAMMIIAASGDVHDDVIDCSTEKYGVKTVLGKFGAEVTIVVGDSLLMQGTNLLQEAIANVSKEKKQTIVEIVSSGLFEIGKAEIAEMSMKGKFGPKPKEFFELMRQKGIVAQTQFEVGSILGGADKETQKALSRIGSAIGTLLTIKDEFRDLTDLSELKHRLQNEYLPLPMIYAAQSPDVKDKIEALLEKEAPSESDVDAMALIVRNSDEVRKLNKTIKGIVEKEIKNIDTTKMGGNCQDIRLLLQALPEG